MAKTGLWSDRRSGAAGQIAGNLVLEDLAHRFGETITRRKGTTFYSGKHLYVGRFIRGDSLVGDQVHWANVSPRQLTGVTREARREKRKPLFVFITATPQEVHYWLVPATVVGRVITRQPVKRSDKSCALKIRRQEQQFLLEHEDVTRHHRILKPEARVITELSKALDRSRKSSGQPSRLVLHSDSSETGQPADVHLNRLFQHGEELAVVLPREVVERSSLSAGSLVEASASGGAILLRPVEVVPKLMEDDQRFSDELFRRRKHVFEALSE